MILFLNSIGIWEILLILLIVLMLFGAKSIPSIARNLGRGVRQMKDVTQDIQRDINASTHKMKEDLNENVNRPAREIEEAVEGKEKQKDSSENKEKP